MNSVYLSGSAPIDFSSNNLGESNNPFLRALVRRGFFISPIEVAGTLININHNSKTLGKVTKGASIFKVLIRTEPISVFPAQYTQRVEDRYDLVLTTGLPKGDYGKFVNFPYPYKTLSNPNFAEQTVIDSQSLTSRPEEQIHSLAQWKNRRIFLSLIASNKVSSQRESNYGLRRSFAEKSTINNLEIYGPLWNKSYMRKIRHRIGVGLHAFRNGTPPDLRSLYGALHKNYENYKGTPRDKQLIMRDSKFALVIENSNTYVSEKLFDAFVGGSIPVYFGPDLSQYGVSEEFLVIRHKGSVCQLHSQLNNLTEKEVSIRLNAIEQFVDSHKFKSEWAAEFVFSTMASEIARRRMLS